MCLWFQKIFSSRKTDISLHQTEGHLKVRPDPSLSRIIFNNIFAINANLSNCITVSLLINPLWTAWTDFRLLSPAQLFGPFMQSRALNSAGGVSLPLTCLTERPSWISWSETSLRAFRKFTSCVPPHQSAPELTSSSTTFSCCVLTVCWSFLTVWRRSQRA